ncbi:MAG: nicotinate-nucleotide diphosphorylase (carboxylating) [Omnitrophica WOR_2 bacterium GWF2_43_52]|nr:MAG: nicotinate-nucleotide diphosphorylase (carboxylating) [Omnitrophica WOR_2 bacterium GWF2_43_52]OGX53315.1 MAG: nicotinate-nucleotide diphosphorylase (carboxylating) [Omnitrophica WOR_2 bacterium RIFOXYC2_FULL_43_9]HAH19289.1 carboxylating nicotinate-nucleotide diphosphorylase [Candidatus Omnitrophota bacterium]HBG63688.1 carboxylating nicotinate-nucleotide diphosphorylase [Candidatus Omnitrophota bacterium]
MKKQMLHRVIKDALTEDIGGGDITSRILIPKGKKIKAVLFLKERGVVAGLAVARNVFKIVNTSVTFKAHYAEGSWQNAGKILATVEGDAHAILKAERTALNLLSHLCAIATAARKFVDRVKPYKVKILDTRKTIPGLRDLQKYAVSLGGGCNHRMGLWDGILIKDNHIAIGCRGQGLGYIEELIGMAKKRRPKGLKIEIEVKNLQEFRQALKAEPDIIMLDNMKIADIRKAVEIRRTTQGVRQSSVAGAQRMTQIEASGGVHLDNVRAIAKTGVDSISIGSLTHSVKAIDISLEVAPSP